MANKTKSIKGKDVLHLVGLDGTSLYFMTSLTAAKWIISRTHQNCTNSTIDNAAQCAGIYGIENSKGFIRGGLNWKVEKIDGSNLRYGDIIDCYQV